MSTDRVDFGRLAVTLPPPNPVSYMDLLSFFVSGRNSRLIFATFLFLKQTNRFPFAGEQSDLFRGSPGHLCHRGPEDRLLCARQLLGPLCAWGDSSHQGEEIADDFWSEGWGLFPVVHSKAFQSGDGRKFWFRFRKKKNVCLYFRFRIFQILTFLV